MIFDWKNNKKEALKNGIVMEQILGVTRIIMKTSDGAVSHHTFRNFSKLEFEDDSRIEQCMFEDCGEISACDGIFQACEFHHVDSIFGHYTDFINCHFQNCSSIGPLLTIDSTGGVDECVFENITAQGEDGYIIFSVYNKKSDVKEIKNCKFIHWHTENPDNDISYCEYHSPFIFGKPKYINNIHYESCDIDEGDIIEIGSFSV